MENLKKQMSQMRREFHQIAELGWLEFQTTIKIINYLKSYGYDVEFGKKIHNERMGLPDYEEIKKYGESLSFDVDYNISEILEGYTGVVTTLDTGKRGPTIAVRFDIDANGLEETYDEDHIPNKESFRSENNFAMHACGHDGHITIGLTLAKWLMKNKNNLKGKFIFIFQPAEEQVGGAMSMVGAGIVDDVDYLLSGHIGLGVESGVLGLGTVGFLATSKLDVYFEGTPSHAGAAPELGRNALLAASSCAINLHTLTQFGAGISRLNVGTLNAGTSRNIVPSTAIMQIETRGENDEINEALKEKAYSIIEGSAKAFDVRHKIIETGRAPSYNSYNNELLALVKKHLNDKFKILVARSFGASEDITLMMNRVEKNGGKSLHFMFGSDLTAAHHNNKFDFDEDTLTMAFKALSETIKLLVK